MFFNIPEDSSSVFKLLWWSSSPQSQQTTIQKSIFGRLATEHTRSIQKNIIVDLKLAYLIVSYNSVPT